MKWLVRMFEGAGFAMSVGGRSLGFMLRRPRLGMSGKLAYDYGLKSLPVVLVVALFSGMIICLQTGIQVAQFGEEEVLGIVVAQTFAREFGPFMTCIILVGTAVSAFAAEIGTMKVSEEVDALEVMSIDPVRMLVTPRVVAVTLMTFVLTILVDFVGVLGGGLVAMSRLGVSFESYLDWARRVLDGTDFLGFLPKDVYSGLLQALVFGLLISSVACSQGLRARGGALGVGRAVRKTVVASIMLTLVFGFLMTAFLYT